VSLKPFLLWDMTWENLNKGGFIMTENEKRDVAVFRYSIISDLVNARDLSWGEQERLINPFQTHHPHQSSNTFVIYGMTLSFQPIQ
jgi:hypothetical protein